MLASKEKGSTSVRKPTLIISFSFLAGSASWAPAGAPGVRVASAANRLAVISAALDRGSKPRVGRSSRLAEYRHREEREVPEHD